MQVNKHEEQFIVANPIRQISYLMIVYRIIWESVYTEQKASIYKLHSKYVTNFYLDSLLMFHLATKLRPLLD